MWSADNNLWCARCAIYFYSGSDLFQIILGIAWRVYKSQFFAFHECAIGPSTNLQLFFTVSQRQLDVLTNQNQ